MEKKGKEKEKEQETKNVTIDQSNAMQCMTSSGRMYSTRETLEVRCVASCQNETMTVHVT
jgi:hypothetical protein